MSYPPNPYAESVTPRTPSVFRGDAHRVWQLVVGIVAFFAAQLVAGVVTFFSALLRGSLTIDAATGAGASVRVVRPDGSTADVAQAGMSVFGGLDMLIGMVVGAALSFVFYLLIMRFIAGNPGLGLGKHQRLIEFVTGLGTGLVLMGVSVGVIALFGGYRTTGITTGPALWDGLFYAAAIGIGAGFMEEILFRGFLLRVLDAWLGSWAALAITSVLFGLVHLSNPGASVFGAVAIMLEAGVLLGAAYLLTRRLWLAIGIHVAWNFVQGGIFSSNVSGTGERTGLFEAHWSGPAWLTGGSMGIEASVVTLVVALAAGIVLLALARHQGMLLGPVRRTRA
ncbi:CPBP family intramembrane metalloprotease [Brevibacterium sp. 91QC2O2]|uniref:CPBP family intramembrane glutamic endopeptidase n=1 Tax=Brevibacterium TaxID=1696 RepID=UPI00211CB44A|nr:MULTISPECIES: CPBP family intramembrane glutamic endopeptidase [unclassified Brevibacterium]MCQ9368249.1 CPBP family intramembrane metalloprotease [Brevibacterium sp. 91QC2O2]MCQ9385587.1 CPBP family intramembrane metalloprotease [Brevibacterium sp. 68QC2CO]